ncbi:carbon-nitrogen hydrolase family protein [Paludisphaera mucosa]|uniref:Carbon-nitrogen hydrolase family protein n=1 Tax=Paludisphaera mucosa TaxID=3030827 RepID=A0ABT6FCQ8_9BACT|nr:carbon-nitrogen hydrolase family protein [Paludisphaera mucosa]MDG3005352.1 carbon-nitrogen hydrolase family protein [Paludisphaera mucosa]
MFLAAVIQTSSTTDVERNLAEIEALVARAAGYGAKFVGTPENANFLGPAEEKVGRAEALDGPTCSRLAELARRHTVYLLLGSFNERGATPGRCRNTSVLFGPDGSRLATYRKIHLFDVDHSDAVRAMESRTIEPGDEEVVAETALGRFGLSVCYDLRFGDQYRRLVRRGAEMLCVPAAFTMRTGRDHWSELLRARAIECQAYVLAPAQFGRHGDSELRESYGRAMIVDPWGVVLATAADGPSGLALAEIDLARVAEIRRAIPVGAYDPA